MKRSLCCSLNRKVSEYMLFFKDNVDEMFYYSLKKKFILKRYQISILYEMLVFFAIIIKVKTYNLL